MSVVTYDSNNSGGSWWLTDEDWKNLEAAGWEVDWYATSEHRYRDMTKYGGDANHDTYPDGRFLGALASKATREGLTMREAIEEWERITGEQSNAIGCNCCGSPHSFSSDDGEYYTPSQPLYGDRY